jgi:hypothetical protein
MPTTEVKMRPSVRFLCCDRMGDHFRVDHVESRKKERRRLKRLSPPRRDLGTRHLCEARRSQLPSQTLFFSWWWVLSLLPGHSAIPQLSCQTYDTLPQTCTVIWHLDLFGGQIRFFPISAFPSPYNFSIAET